MDYEHLPIIKHSLLIEILSALFSKPEVMKHFSINPVKKSEGGSSVSCRYPDPNE